MRFNVPLIKQIKHAKTTIVVLKGLVKLKNSKNPKKTRIGQTPLTHSPIHFFRQHLENV